MVHGKSLVVTAMQYARESAGGIAYMYGVPGNEAVGTVLRGSYNTYLGQNSDLILLNPTPVARRGTFSMTRSDSTLVLPGERVEIPAHGVKIVSLNEREDEDHYGIVTMQPDYSNTVLAWVLRTKAGQYSIPTPTR